MKILDLVTTLFLIIGGLNWGLVGFFDFNLVTTVFGEAGVFGKMIYALVGLSALYDVFSFSFGYKAMQHRWCESSVAVKH